MLLELRIVNFALIEELHIDFSDGLGVFTGETGAGKSIILQAIHLLRGGRGSASWVRSGADFASVEALFEYDADSPETADVRARGFDCDGSIVIKRVLARDGRSRFHVNGSPANGRTVEEIAENLLSVASQHEHQRLLSTANHLYILDDMGDLQNVREKYARAYQRCKDLEKEYESLRSMEREKEQRRDFLAYQRREIEAADIESGEDARLAEEKARLKSADELQKLGGESSDILNNAVLDGLRQASRNLARMAELDRMSSPLAEEVAGSVYQLEDGLIRLRRYIDDIPDDPGRLEIVTERLHLLTELKRKYGDTLEEVLAHGERAAEELRRIEGMEERLHELERELDGARREVMAEALGLSAARKEVAASLEGKMGEELLSLSFDTARFRVLFHEEGERSYQSLTAGGADRPEFLFSANAGEPEKPLARVASGGELSRLMLALKCMLARKDRVRTVIFDEVDSGIGGQAASMVAAKIKELAGHHQVVCITHLAQIASLADEHFVVRKSVRGDRTVTEIEKLTAAGRVDELARMLDGEAATEQTVAYARELLSRKSGLVRQGNLFDP